jgi:predicted N-acyltransferase
VDDFEVQVIQRVSDIGPEKWDAIAHNNPLASFRWYEFGETVLDDAAPLYILLSRNGEPISRATFWLLRHEPLPVPLKLVRSAMASAFRRWPLLMCRTPLTDISGLILPEELNLRDAALRTFARIAREWGREHGASFTVFDYLDIGEFTLSEFPLIDMAGSSTRLLNRWDNFDDYLKQLGSSARKDYNRHRNRAADMHLVVQAQNRVTNIDRAIELIRNVEQHHNTATNPYLRRVLENVHMADATWLTAEIEGRMVGCGLLMGDNSTRILTCLGLDYDVQYVYFQMVYAAIRSAIEANVQLVRGGGGAYEFKQRLGFETVNNTQIAVVSSNAVFVNLIRRLAG